MAELNPAEQMRVMLMAMRERGWEFGAAWPNAIQRIRVQPYMSKDEADDLAEWKRWLTWAKPAFAAAFDRTPPPPLNGEELFPASRNGTGHSAGAPLERPTGSLRVAPRASQTCSDGSDSRHRASSGH